MTSSYQKVDGSSSCRTYGRAIVILSSCIVALVLTGYKAWYGFVPVGVSTPAARNPDRNIISCADTPGLHIVLTTGRVLVEPARPGQVCVLIDESGTVWGRSYDGYAWETVRQTDALLTVDSLGVGVVKVPHDKTLKLQTHGEETSGLEQNQTQPHGRSLDSRYYYTSRFLMQATFGPKFSEIMGFDGTIKAWIRKQIRVPATSHRAYFRRRANPRAETPTFTGRPRTPCEEGSRWTQFSFVETDNAASVKVQKIGSQITVVVDGEVRTQVDEASWGDALKLKSFKICRVTELPGAQVAVAKNCKSKLTFLPNPPLVQDDGAEPFHTTTSMRAELVEMIAPAPGIKVLKPRGTDPIRGCQGDGSALVFIRDQRGVLYRHDRRLVLMSNGVGNPAAGYDLKYSPNAPKTFVNKDGCVVGGVASTKTAFDSVPVHLSPENVLKFHKRGVLAYKIQGLTLENELAPCDSDTSYWQILGCENLKAVEGGEDLMVVDEDTRKTLLGLLKPQLSWIKAIKVPKGAPCKAPKGARLQNTDTTCFQHVHPDTGNVYDFSNWASPGAHPGNRVFSSKGLPNPIKNPANLENFALNYPESHSMDRWDIFSKQFPLVGRMRFNVSFTDLPASVKTVEVAKAFGAAREVVIAGEDLTERCGSYGEVANEPMLGNRFHFAQMSQREVQFPGPNSVDFPIRNNHIKNAIWNGVVLNAQDQLRQRVAFALSQILVVTKVQVPGFEDEIYANYYDIFVRNGLANYADVLREVTYSPMMAAMLTYENSRSVQNSIDRYGKKLFPDENYAREIMQLFTVGLYQLDRAGRVQTKDGVPLKTYTNADIMDFSRVFTGFRRQNARANFEGQSPTNPRNRIDPLRLDPSFRDVFPKMNLYGGYLGDGYPLCTDLPSKMFLRKTAVYRYVGSRNMPETIGLEPESFLKAQRLELSKASMLYKALCNSGTGTVCRYRSEVVLSSTLTCSSAECEVDDPRLVKVGKAFYEFVRPPCADLPFISHAVQVMPRYQRDARCVDKATVSASTACCTSGGSSEEEIKYDGELTSYATAEKRCKSIGRSLCRFKRVQGRVFSPIMFWTNAPCTIRMKVRFDGYVALIHGTTGAPAVKSLDSKNFNFFRVGWYGEYPTPKNQCLGTGAVSNGFCLCDVVVKELQVFDTFPSKASVLEKLSIGSLNPNVIGGYALTKRTSKVAQYNLISAGKVTKDTIFEVRAKGVKTFFRNKISVVFARDGRQRLFRNPSNLMNFVQPTIRDCEYEVEALLKHLLYYPSTPAFIAYRMIQRFVTSNPSNRYIEVVANAFVVGEYDGIGSREYGSLSATVAAVLLDREARSSSLESDPTFGQLREPLLKIVHFWRSMEVSADGNREIEVAALEDQLGQQAMTAPNVFNFFRPEYSPPGVVSRAGLVAPEAQILTAPKVVKYVNGMISSAKLGLTNCLDGFVHNSVPGRQRNCGQLERSSESKIRSSALANLNWKPAGGLSRADADAVIAELDLLLTAGRLEPLACEIIAEQYNIELRLNGPLAAMKTAQQLVTASPEYQITNQVQRRIGRRRPSAEKRPAKKPYKAIVYVYLSGGLDSFNLLVPLSGCRGKDMFAEYTKVRSDVAMGRKEILPIKVPGSSQICSTFGVHNSMKIFQKMYNQEEALFFANTGVMVEPLTKAELLAGTKRVPESLYAHNIQTFSTQTLNPLSRETIGVLGRAHDELWETNFSPGAFSVGTPSNVLEPRGSISPQPFSVKRKGTDKFNPSTFSDRRNAMNDAILSLSKDVSSSLFGETWGDILENTFNSTKLLADVLERKKTRKFAEDSGLSNQLQQVAKLIKSRGELSMDRQAFYVGISGLDTHSNNDVVVREKLDELNSALTDFIAEMKEDEVWEDVVVLQASEFGRTLTSNGAGTDHGWGGNYMMFGGGLKGKQIIGEFPDDLTEGGKLNIGRGRILPTLSWDAIWNAILQWYGVRPNKLSSAIPNRNNFLGKLLNKNDLFRIEEDRLLRQVPPL